MRAFRTFCLLALLCCGALTAAPSHAGAPPQTAAARAADVDVRVASFNIKNVLFARRPEANWKKRRQVIIDQVLSERVGVLGIQEAHQGKYVPIDYPDGANQYLDLVGGLNAAGGTYKLTTRAPYNCVNPDSWHNCKYRDRGASRSTRIIYDHSLYELVDDGSVMYRRQTSEDRYLVWAVFRVRESGQKFFFTTTHLTSGAPHVRRAQWRHSIRIINRLRGDLPVIATGDYNANKFTPLTREMLPAMRQAGYGDVLNQQWRVNPVRNVRAESTVNGWINSFNHGRRNVASFSFEDARHLTGQNLDWVFASNGLRVKQWKVVLNYDPQTLRVQGPIASDHNMVRATVTLP